MFDVDIFGNNIIKLPFCSLLVLESDACILVGVDNLCSTDETKYMIDINHNFKKKCG